MSLKEDAFAFQSVLNPKTKKVIESILDAVDSSSCYSGDKAQVALTSIIGSKPTNFLKELLDSYDLDGIKNLEEISEETRSYLKYLFGRYAYKLHGVISRRLLERPDEWNQVSWVSVRYDATKNDLLLRINIQKTNKEWLTLEDSWGNLLHLYRHLIRYLVERPELDRFKPNVYIDKKDTDAIINYMNILNEKMFGPAK
jgi:hypothetical protein